MSSLRIVFIFLSIYRGPLFHCATNYRFLLEPHDITTFSGRDVLIPCRIGLNPNHKLPPSQYPTTTAINESTILPPSSSTEPTTKFYDHILPHVQWVKDGFALGTYLDLLEYSTKMTMRGDMKKGDFHLEIISVSEEDAGTYQCQITPSENFIGAVSQKANLTVLVLPGKPEIMNGPVIETQENSAINITCRTKEGYPRNSISIYTSKTLEPHQTIGTTEWELRSSGSRLKWLYKSMVIKVDPSMNGCTVICEALYDLSPFNFKDGSPYKVREVWMEESKSRSLLNVRYAPKVYLTPTGRHMHSKAAHHHTSPHDPVENVETAGGGDKLLEGSKLRLTCVVNSNPKPNGIEWYINGNRLENYTDSSLLYNPVTRHHHGDMVKCVARNALGLGSSDYELEVIYGAQFVVRPITTLPVDLGDHVNFTCLADANPLPSYSWIKMKQASDKTGDKYFDDDDYVAIKAGTIDNSINGGNNDRKTRFVRNVGKRARNKYTEGVGADPNTVFLSSVPYLIFDRVLPTDIGSYRCTVKQEQLPPHMARSHKRHHHHYQSLATSAPHDITSDAELILKARPRVYKLGVRSINHLDNGLFKIVLKCVIRSAPRIHGLIWTLNGKPLDQQNYPYDIKNTEDEENYWAMSKLVMELNPNFIESATSFNCTALNDKGQDSKVWLLHSKDLLIPPPKDFNTMPKRQSHHPTKIITTNYQKNDHEAVEDYYTSNEEASSQGDSWLRKLSFPWMMIGFGLIFSIFLAIGATFFVCDYKKRHNRKSSVSTSESVSSLKRDGKKGYIRSNKNSLTSEKVEDLTNGSDRNIVDKSDDYSNAEIRTASADDHKDGTGQKIDYQDYEYSIKEYKYVEHVSSDSALSCDGSEEIISPDHSVPKIKIPQMSGRDVEVSPHEINLHAPPTLNYLLPRLLTTARPHNASSLPRKPIVISYPNMDRSLTLTESGPLQPPFFQNHFSTLQQLRCSREPTSRHPDHQSYLTMEGNRSRAPTLMNTQLSEESMDIFYNRHHLASQNFSPQPYLRKMVPTPPSHMPDISNEGGEDSMDAASKMQVLMERNLCYANTNNRRYTYSDKNVEPEILTMPSPSPPHSYGTERGMEDVRDQTSARYPSLSKLV